MRAIKDNSGNLLLWADEILRMAEWMYKQGVHYLRVKAGSGVFRDRQLAKDIYKMEEEYSFPPTLVGVLPESGRVERASGIYRFASRLFNLGAGVKYNATQLVTNGNFANGTTGWKVRNSTHSASGGILTNTGDGTTMTAAEETNTTIQIIGSNKYYVRFRARVTGAGCTNLRLRSDFSAIVVNAAGAVQNQWYDKSDVVTIGGTSSSNRSILIEHSYATAADALGKVMEIDFAYIINLTATFGAGNEPSKEVCDVIFADYFDGTKEVQLNDVIQSTANSQPYLFKKGIKNPNGGSRSMTHQTVSFADNDAWSVSFVFRYNFASPSNIFSVLFSNFSSNVKSAITMPTGLSSFSFRNELSQSVNIGSVNTGKTQYMTLVARGDGTLDCYKNGVYIETKNIITNFVWQVVLNGGFVDRPFFGNLFYHFIRSGALTPEQITAEYNLLSSYFPEISTVQVGSKHIATDNCEMVATPKGNVIALNNLAGNVEKLLNTSFDTTANWSTLNPDQWSFGSGSAIKITGTGNTYIQQSAIITKDKWYKVRLNISAISGQLTFTNQANQFLFTSSYTLYNASDNTLYYKALENATAVKLFGLGATTLTLLDFEMVEMNWAGAQDLYNGLISQGSTVSGALKAAAMWRSPDSDLDRQAVYGKLFNGYAVDLLKMDIDTYNAENPTEPWGYHIATRADLNAIATELGGADVAGMKMKETGTDYWLSDNGDNTSGVSVLGSGLIDENGNYVAYNEATGIWTSDNFDANNTYVATLHNDLDKLIIE